MAALLDRQAGLTLRRFTVDEFHRMADIGLFGDSARVELLDGLIVAMPPIGSRHGFIHARIIAELSKALGPRGVLSTASVPLGPHDEPQPDIVVVSPAAATDWSRRLDYSEVLVAVEVADSTLRKDTFLKRKLYARFGIPDYLVVDAKRNLLL